MTLEQFIKDAPKFQVVTRGETPKESARNVYDLALSLAKLPESEDRKDALAMIIRAAGCLLALIEAASSVEREIHEELGLIGGATGDATMADLQHMTAEESLKLFHITATIKELESMKPDLLQILHEVTERRAA